MARSRPTNSGGWLHTAIRLSFIAVSIALFVMTAYTIALSHEGGHGLVITGAIVSILGDISSILLYKAKSSTLASTIVADIFAIVFCAVGAVGAAMSGFSRGDDPHPPKEPSRADDVRYTTLKLALAVIGLRTVSIIATTITSCVMVRRWKREREAEEEVTM